MRHFEIRLTICTPFSDEDEDEMLDMVLSSLDYYSIPKRGVGIVSCDCNRDEDDDS